MVVNAQACINVPADTLSPWPGLGMAASIPKRPEALSDEEGRRFSLLR